MNIGARATTFLLISLLVFVVGGVLLQIFLSKRESKWPGLVLPCITCLYSVLMVLNVAAMGDTQGMMVTVTAVLITGNIPTLILLAIYVACRGSRKKKSEVHKMQIEDL